MLLKGKLRQSNNKEDKVEDVYAEASIEDVYRIEVEKFEDVLYIVLTESDLNNLFMVCAYTITNYCGSPGPKYLDTSIDLLNYINRNFRISKSEKYDLTTRAKSVKPPPYFITVDVIEASDLTPTDPDGLSDPFCKVWITENPSTKHQTAVIDSSVNPSWNETCSFSIEHFPHNALHIEIWDMDPRGIAAAVTQLKYIKGFGGFLIYCRELKDSCRCWGSNQVDDFLGRLTIDLQTISCEGMDEWFSLRNQKGETGIGEIHIATQLNIMRPNDIKNSLKRHLLLFKFFLERGMKDMAENSLSKFQTWEETMPSSALTLLFQHAFQSSISRCEYCLERWIVIDFVARKENYIFSYEFLYNLLCDIHKEFFLATNVIVDSSLEDLFRQKLAIFSTTCYRLLDSLHSSGCLETEESCKEFEYVLRCIYLCQEILDLEVDPLVVLAQRALEWFETSANETYTEIKNNSECAPKLIINLLYTFQQCQVNTNLVICKVRPSKNFSQLTYESLWSVICNVLKSTIVELIEKTSKIEDTENKDSHIKDIVQIIFYLGELWKHAQKICGDDFTEKWDSYQNWFEIKVAEEWFQYREHQIISKLRKWVEHDEFAMVENVDNIKSAKISTSTIEIMNTIDENLVNLWTMLSFPGSKMDDFLAESLYHCCLKYIGLLLDEIHNKHLFENYEQDGKKKLAVAANDLYTLAIFGDLTKFEGYLRSFNVPDVKTELSKQCADLCTKIAEPKKVVITDLIEKIPVAKKSHEQESAVGKYEAYIVRLIWDEACVDMRFEVFCLFVKDLWDHVVDIVAEIKNIYKEKQVSFLEKISSCLRRINVFQGLLSALMKTEKLVHAEHECLPIKLVHTEQYLETRDDLTILAR